MVAVAQWQSTALWMQMLWVRPPSATQEKTVDSSTVFSLYDLNTELIPLILIMEYGL